MLQSGKLLLNGRPADLKAIEDECRRLQQVHGTVWYYRENSQDDPQRGAMAVMDVVMKYRLPVSMSSKADFSDYIDEDGFSRPR